MAVDCLLSVLVPVYNGENDIKRCIESVIFQDFLNGELEIIIINDGSTDGTKEILDEYVEKYSFIKAYHFENKGLSATRNKALTFAKGKYVYFFDSDDYLAPNCLKPIINKMISNGLEFLGFDSLKTNFKDFSDFDDVNSIVDNKDKVTSGVDFMSSTNFKNTVWWYILDRCFLLETGIKNDESDVIEDGLFTSSILLLTSKMMYLPIKIHAYYNKIDSLQNNKEPSHYKKMIYRYGNTALTYQNVIDTAILYKVPIEVLNRLKAKQQSYIFFLKLILKRFEEVKIYPLKSFIGKDYNILSYRFLTLVFNNNLLLRSVLKLSAKISKDL